jgi:hypothetical protein
VGQKKRPRTRTAIIEISTEQRTHHRHRTHLAIPQGSPVEVRTEKVSALLGRRKSRGPQSAPAGQERNLLGKATTRAKPERRPPRRNASKITVRSRSPAREIKRRWPSSAQARGCSLAAERRIGKRRRQSRCALIMLPPRRLLPSAAGRADRRRRVAHARQPRR